LLPLNASIESVADLPIEALKAKDILTQMRSSGSRVNVMVLDACRNLPYPQLKRGGNRGLARLDAIGRALIAYSTSPGSTADDGNSRNSPYTAALKKLLPKKNLTLTQLFNDVGVMVDTNSGGKQTPWVSSSPMPRVYLAGVSNLAGANNNAAPSTLAITDTPTHPGRKPYEPETIFIRGSTFTMGSPASEKGRYSDEKPHQVRVNDFWIGKTEVTFAQWDACVADGGCQSNKHPSDEGWGRGNRPVINVSWHDANEYTRWLSQKTGKQYRLPTEAEWEYAARSGTHTAFSFGNSYKQLCQYANHADQSVDYSWRNKQCNDGVGEKTAPVGRYKANKNGLKDMHGNVWEWVCSAYDKNYGGSERQCAKKNDPRSRVLRGGSWNYIPWTLRSAYRYNSAATIRSDDVGFRISRTN